MKTHSLATTILSAGGVFALAACSSTDIDATTTSSAAYEDGTPSAPDSWDPRQPGPNDLFTAADGSPDYLHSLIPTNPKLDPNSAAILAKMDDDTPRLNGPEWQMTIFTAKNSDPVYEPSFVHGSDWGCSVGGSIHIPDYATREIPGDGDGWLIIANKEEDTVKSIWVAKKSGNVWSGDCGGSYRLSGNGAAESKLAGVGTGSETQAGFGFIQYSELQAGAIEHALYFTSTITCRAFRKPAGKSDGDGGGKSCVPMGARVQLDPSVDCDRLSGASKGEKTICKAMQKYGGYVLDSGGPGPLSGIGMAGDDLTDPDRKPWKTPGDGMRRNRGCSPVGPNCGIVSNVGLDGTKEALAHIPWNELRILANWEGK